MTSQNPTKTLGNWCICGHDDWSHHPSSWECQVEGCYCSRFSRKKEPFTKVGDAVNFFNQMDKNLKEQEPAPFTIKHYEALGKPALTTAGEWTPNNISEMIGETVPGIVTYTSFNEFVKAVCVTHNAALAAERGRAEGQEQRAEQAERELIAARGQLPAEREKNDDWRNTERRVARERDTAREQLDAAMAALKRPHELYYSDECNYRTVEVFFKKCVDYCDATLAKIKEGK
jgi:hypothetical protein